MYESAAAKGSTDAMVALGLMFVTGQTAPQSAKGGLYPHMNWQEGLTLIEKGTQNRCWYWQSVIVSISSSNCLRPYSPAGIVWPKFRDGRGVPKDKQLADYWKAKHQACESRPEYIQAQAICR